MELPFFAILKIYSIVKVLLSSLFSGPDKVAIMGIDLAKL
jgi:hypothetical protein